MNASFMAVFTKVSTTKGDKAMYLTSGILSPARAQKKR
jgi:hypothetical protein